MAENNSDNNFYNIFIFDLLIFIFNLLTCIFEFLIFILGLFINMTKGCKKCFQTNVWYYRCNECNAKQFQQDFPNWTSGNEFIDRFIQETQLNVQSNFIVIEWVPYN